MFIELTPATSPKTLTTQDFNELVNFPYLLVLASGGGTLELNLPSIANIISSGLVYVLCNDGSTTVDINANDSDSITSAGTITQTITISGDKSYANIQCVNYATGKIWINNGASSGTGGVLLRSFDVTVPAVRVNQLLNDVSLADVLIPAPSNNQVIEIHTCNFRLEKGTVGRDGTNPQIGIFGLENQNNNFIYATSNTPYNFLVSNPSSTIVFAEYAGFGAREVSVGEGAVGAILIGGLANAAVTQGDGDLRIFGTYSIKQL